ncbi:hypothetical protein AB0G73_37135, partial [Streptomyces sp. NPDC020719]|uniref:hypothetical protein n=1 Tax=Streptomyces sp. NPDC020719 TaxID=3154896 RepID=UPI00340147FD
APPGTRRRGVVVTEHRYRECRSHRHFECRATTAYTYLLGDAVQVYASSGSNWTYGTNQIFPS